MRTIGDIVGAVRSGATSAEAVVRESLERIDSLDDRYGAFLSVEAEHALGQARRVDEKVKCGSDLPLAGVPIALKDNLCTTFGTTTCASRALRDYRSPYNAHVVDRLLEAGAVVVGKTNLDEFAMGSSTEHSSVQCTRNPWDTDRVPGGSSGGSAVAVATGMVAAALGSDTGGSIRQPAALTGVVGLKPTYGRVSRYGLVAFGSSLDQIGPLTRTVEDAAVMLSVIACHDSRDSTCVDQPVPRYDTLLNRPIRGSRLGVVRESLGEGLDADSRSAFEGAVELFRGEGAQIVDVALSHMKYGVACYYIVATAEASSNLARYDGIHYGLREEDSGGVIDTYAASREAGFGAEVKRRIMLGTFALSTGYYDAYYLRALKVRTLLRRDFEKAFEQVDAIISPVSPVTAFGIGERMEDPIAMYLADVYTIGANLAGLPALALPCGFDRKGLPIGMQLLGPVFSEDRLLGLGHQYQCVTEHHLKSPAMK